MQRMHWSLGSLALISLTGVPLMAQDDWKPVSSHRARYESVDGSNQQQMPLIGRPITGRSKIDRAVEPASFGDQRNSAPLPQAPTAPPQVETLPFPNQVVYPQGQVMYPQGAVQAGKPNSYPMSNVPTGAVTYPNGTVVYPMGTVPNGAVAYPSTGTIQPVPQQAGGPVVVQGGPVMGGPVTQGTFLPEGCMPGMPCYEGGMSDRYFLQAIHGSPGIWYGSFDFLLYSLSKDESPPLVITGPQTTTNINSPGVSVLYGGTLPSETLYGGRATLGVWFNRCQTWGLFGSYFTTVASQDSFRAESRDGSTFLARPFFNVSPINFDGTTRMAGEALEIVSQTGIGGTVDVLRTSQLRGAELNFRFNLFNNTMGCRRIHWNIDGYAGVKYYGLDESLTVTENIEVLPNTTTTVAPGTKFFVQDSFTTRNTFIGGNIGLMSEARLGRFFVSTRSGVAIGANRQEIVIDGGTIVTPPNQSPSDLQTGGLLAQESNIGRYKHSQFSIVPEFGVKLGLQVTDCMRIFAGYDMMYWTNVVRPGQQIDYTVNASQVPFFPQATQGPARPAFNLQTSNLWVSGFSAGLSWTF